MMSRDELLQAIAAPGPTDIFATAYAQLCEISYLPVAQIAGAVNGLKTPWLGDGTWKCLWGPTVDPTKGNLTFIAAYYFAAPALRPIVFRAVVPS